MPFDFAKKMGTCSFFVAVESNPDRNSNHRLKCDWEVTWRWVKTDLIWLTSDECIVRSRSDRLLPAALLPPLPAAATSDFAISRGAARLCRMSVIQSDTQTQHTTLHLMFRLGKCELFSKYSHQHIPRQDSLCKQNISSAILGNCTGWVELLFATALFPWGHCNLVKQRPNWFSYSAMLQKCNRLSE